MKSGLSDDTRRSSGLVPGLPTVTLRSALAAPTSTESNVRLAGSRVTDGSVAVPFSSDVTRRLPLTATRFALHGPGCVGLKVTATVHVVEPGE